MTNRPTDKQVLYVDDEPQALKYFARLFGDQFSIATAESADQAVEYIDQRGGQVGVLVTDQRMPGKTGVQLMEQLRFRHPNIVRVLLTAYSELDAAVKAVNEGGAFRYLTKPLNEDEMVGTLLRALEHHAALDDRDRLLREKLSVLHRLIVMDRIRGLATATTALQGRLNNAWPALVAYMRQSPARQRIKIQMDEIIGLNMVGIARREAELMVRTVEMILADTVQASTGWEDDLDVAALLQSLVGQLKSRMRDDDVEISLTDDGSPLRLMHTDRGMLQRLLTIVMRRIADLQDQPTQIEIQLTGAANQQAVISIKGDFGQLKNGQIASLFAAAIPLQKWPIGLDMDLLSAYMIVHHLGGQLKVETHPPGGPGVQIRLPVQPSATQQAPLRADWFDTVYESLQEWESELTLET